MKELKEIEKLLSKKKQPKNSVKEKKDWELLEFKRRLNQSPPESILRTNPEFGNKYIPIQYVEVMLDILFDSREFVMTHKPDYVDGQTVFYMDVVVTNPVTGQKQRYSGTSVVGTIPNSNNYRDVHKRIPAGESFAILNAVQKIGRLFRPQNETFTSALDNYFEKEVKGEKSKMFDRLDRMINDLSVDPDEADRAFMWVQQAYKKEELTKDEANALDDKINIKYKLN